MTDISPEDIERLVKRLRNPSQQWNVTEACADAADAITALRQALTEAQAERASLIPGLEAAAKIAEEMPLAAFNKGTGLRIAEAIRARIAEERDK